jgi:divalent metal cation (Fe/Co/Zn/Cd) transporter
VFIHIGPGDNALSNRSYEATSKRLVCAALAANAGIASIKFAASLFTESSAMLSEAIHSVVEIRQL